MESGYDIPIGFFTFNRLDTAIEVFNRIREIKPQKLYLVSDGPRDNKEGENLKVREVRDYIESHIDWPCEVKKNYALKNMGCRNRMASGITWLFENEEMAIILEDDVKPGLDFFWFEKEMLERYKDDKRIMMVSGYKYLNQYPINESYTFSNHSVIWGWGTWRRAWENYDVDIKSWPQRKKDGSLRKKFNFLGYKVRSHHFDSVYNHILDTWDYQWGYTVYEKNGLCIVPKVNMIENLGFNRDDATNTKGKTSLDFTVSKMVFPLTHPAKIEANTDYDRSFLELRWGIKAMIKKVMKRYFKV